MDGRYDAAAEAVTQLPPHNMEAEQALLGAVLVWNGALDKAGELQPFHFFDALHGRIFEVARGMHQGGRTVTAVTLMSSFANDEPIKPGLTVVQYLGTLAANAVSLIYVADYAAEIRALYTRRQLILLGQEIAATAQDPRDLKAPEIIAQAETALYGLAESDTYGRGSKHIADIVSDVLVEVNDAHINKGPKGIKTGFIDLDKKLGPLAPGNLIILAGRPSMGKTALCLNMAWQMARAGVRVQFDSLEMSATELGFRLVAERSGISSGAMRNGKDLTVEDFRKLKTAQTEIREAPLWVDDAGGLNIGRLAARARRIKRQRGIQVLFVDYLQLMAGNSNNRVSDVTDITTGLKGLAKELEIPIIALSQLSRKCEERTDKRPQLADLRDSGSIEQDADIVLFVYRDEYYVEREKPAGGSAEWRLKLAEVAGKAEVIVAKQRHGACGIVEMAFNSELTRFHDLVKDPHESVERHQ
jgi:replicative DNA helicase